MYTSNQRKPRTVVIIYWAKNKEVEEKREREREIPKGFWNGGACGGHTFRVDIACTLATKRSDSITHTSMRMHTHTQVWIKLYIQIPNGKKENIFKYLGISSRQVGYFSQTQTFLSFLSLP